MDKKDYMIIGLIVVIIIACCGIAYAFLSNNNSAVTSNAVNNTTNVTNATNNTTMNTNNNGTNANSASSSSNGQVSNSHSSSSGQSSDDGGYTYSEQFGAYVKSYTDSNGIQHIVSKDKSVDSSYDPSTYVQTDRNPDGSYSSEYMG